MAFQDAGSDVSKDVVANLIIAGFYVNRKDFAYIFLRFPQAGLFWSAYQFSELTRPI